MSQRFNSVISSVVKLLDVIGGYAVLYKNVQGLIRDADLRGVWWGGSGAFILQWVSSFNR